MSDYEEDLSNLFHHVTTALPHTVLIWCISPPVGGFVRGGFSCNTDKNTRLNTLRYDMIEAKHITLQVARRFPVQVVDLHHALQPFDYLRESDGIHYKSVATRAATKHILYQLYLTAPPDLTTRGEFNAWRRLTPARIKPEVAAKDAVRMVKGLHEEVACVVQRKFDKMIKTRADIDYFVRDVRRDEETSSPQGKKKKKEEPELSQEYHF